MDSDGGGRCSWLCNCCCLIFILGLTPLVIWLSLLASKNPTCSVQLFYVPTLNQTLATTSNTTVFMTLRFANGNKNIGIDYDDMNLTLSYLRNESNPNSTVLIGKSRIVKFYQGHKKKATKPANVSGGEFNWSEVRIRVFGDNKTAYFRVDLVTAVRFKNMAWRTKRHRIKVGAKVPVNYLGTKVNKDGKVDKKGLSSLVGIEM